MQNLQKKLFKKAQFAAKIAQIIPFVKMIGLNGSLAQNKIKATSDIDFLIVTKYGRVFTARFFIIILYQIFGLKRTNNKIAGQICLNRFITDRSLEIIPKDEYHAKNYALTIPLFDEVIYEDFVKANFWMNKYAQFYKGKKYLSSKILLFFKHIIEFILSGKFGDLIEKKCKQFELKKIISNPLTKEGKGIIIATDKMLCFHPTSNTQMIKIDNVKKT